VKNSTFILSAINGWIKVFTSIYNISMKKIFVFLPPAVKQYNTNDSEATPYSVQKRLLFVRKTALCGQTYREYKMETRLMPEILNL
jgi:hypothetical protein